MTRLRKTRQRDSAEYYFETDEFRRVLKGGVRLVVGRKGSGKTALFFRVRDILREHKGRIVLDLKPEGHQLKRFRELVLGRLTEAVQEHATAAFWEYVLLLEICYKVLEKDRQRHVNDHTLYDGYRKLEDLYLSSSKRQFLRRAKGRAKPVPDCGYVNAAYI